MPDASGIGGRTREDKVMSSVDEAVNGVKSAAAPTSQGGPVQAPRKPQASSYAPSDNASKSRIYGSPIEGNPKTHPAASGVPKSGNPAYAPANQGAVASHTYGSPIEGNAPSK